MIATRETMEVEVREFDIQHVWYVTPLYSALTRDGTRVRSVNGFCYEIDGVLWSCDDETIRQETIFRSRRFDLCRPYVARLIRVN